MPPAAMRLLLVALTLSTPAVAQEREPWADPALPAVGGLHLWLDGARLAAGREALGAPALKEGDPIDVWPDASGNQRHLRQELSEARPTYHTANNFHSVRFDGNKNFLSYVEKDQQFEETTVFLVVAPTSNEGMFAGPMALSAADKNDYMTGLNIDQGPGFSRRIETLNIEGAGASGVVNLLKSKFRFGEVLRMCVNSKPGPAGISVWVNGSLEGSRDRPAESKLQAQRVVLGARFYTNFGPPEPRGFFEGEIAELLLYNRALSNDERTKVEAYLAAKYDAIPPRPTSAVQQGKPLITVDDPPAVQMFVPGFTAKQLPIDLPNINNVLYRPDGRLITLGYDGNIHLLSDTDSDGVEDRAELFWRNTGQLQSPIGMALTPPQYARDEGVFVAAKGKCVLIVDTNDDDIADQEIVVATGWQEIPHGVDALGVAVDPNDGSVFLGIGTKNFTDPYGRSQSKDAVYPLDSERGTILRIASDFKSREIYATGIRFPVSLRFNAQGDLFCSDQEGATWLANGNPLDELLHVESGRHYGFPPRHPRHLPDVIDEPSVFDYAPQHQSLCGINFNHPVTPEGSIFGPEWWRSDCFVAGYSRGKLYRTKLAQTAFGYVAQNQLIASFKSLACDVCLSPQGDLVVATHSGGPDWGSGPSGKGTLFKLHYRKERDAEPELPQPALLWAQAPQELRVAFDQPLEPGALSGLLAGAKIDYGPYVSAGDRFESLRPGYQVVQDQLRAPRDELRIHSCQLSKDGRTLIFSTAVHPTNVNYALTLPGLGRGESRATSDIVQHPECDLQYSLNGVQTLWKSSSDDAAWDGWLPHLDLSVAQHFTAQSSEHDTLWAQLAKPGKLTLKTSLSLDNMLRPKVQPGSKIDYGLPPEQVTLELRCDRELSGRFDGKPIAAVLNATGQYVMTLTTPARAQVPFEVMLNTGSPSVSLDVLWYTEEDARPRALPLHRFALPWARTQEQPLTQVAAIDEPALQGGNWMRGKRVFLGDEAGCAKCHTFGNQGGGVGPDLSNLPHRDYQSVLRDIMRPSYAINPDYVAQSVLLTDGHLITGTVRTDNQQIKIGDAQGRVTTVSLDEVEKIQPSKLSVMPEGLLEKLGDEKTRDLLTYLLTKPTAMPDYGGQRPPPPRSLKEVEALLAPVGTKFDEGKLLKIVLVSGKKDHGPGEHDYPAWQKVWQQLLSMSDHAAVEVATDWPSASQLAESDVLVFYQQGTWNADRKRDMDVFFQRGGGAVYIHYAVDGGNDAPGFAEHIGLAWKGGHSKFRHGPLDLSFAQSQDHHLIARNFDKLHLHDESYWQLLGDARRISLLASGREDDREQPLFWTKETAAGRVFVSIPGHFSWSFDDPLFRVLLLRGIAWAGRAPVDQFNELVLPGARVE